MPPVNAEVHWYTLGRRLARARVKAIEAADVRAFWRDFPQNFGNSFGVSVWKGQQLLGLMAALSERDEGRPFTLSELRDINWTKVRYYTDSLPRGRSATLEALRAMSSRRGSAAHPEATHPAAKVPLDSVAVVVWPKRKRFYVTVAVERRRGQFAFREDSFDTRPQAEAFLRGATVTARRVAVIVRGPAATDERWVLRLQEGRPVEETKVVAVPAGLLPTFRKVEVHADWIARLEEALARVARAPANAVGGPQLAADAACRLLGWPLVRIPLQPAGSQQSQERAICALALLVTGAVPGAERERRLRTSPSKGGPGVERTPSATRRARRSRSAPSAAKTKSRE